LKATGALTHVEPGTPNILKSRMICCPLPHSARLVFLARLSSLVLTGNALAAFVAVHSFVNGKQSFFLLSFFLSFFLLSVVVVKGEKGDLKTRKNCICSTGSFGKLGECGFILRRKRKSVITVQISP
jgi:hypothetical protein